MTVKQAAEDLGVSVALVYQLCSAGKIRHERHGLGRGVIRIPPEALEEYRQSCTIGGQRAEPATPTPVVKPTRPRLKHVRVKPA
jgi:excisionase family DNA binding protein